jgi:hypothetical protein
MKAKVLSLILSLFCLPALAENSLFHSRMALVQPPLDLFSSVSGGVCNIRFEQFKNLKLSSLQAEQFLASPSYRDFILATKALPPKADFSFVNSNAQDLRMANDVVMLIVAHIVDKTIALEMSADEQIEKSMNGSSLNTVARNLQEIAEIKKVRLAVREKLFSLATLSFSLFRNGPALPNFSI